MNIDQIQNDKLLYFNGVNAATGQYTTPPMNTEQLSDLILGKPRIENEDTLYQLKTSYELKDFQPMGPKDGVDPTDLAQSGWGIIFPSDGDPAIKEALSELLQLRKEQAGKYFHIYEGPDGVRGPEQTKLDFLAYHQVGPGPADPENMPYYLLLVGSPNEISYTFQYQLDVQYAVGRIHFETLDEYANYARSVVLAEREPLQLARNAAFFSTANNDDRATQLSTKHMMKPLYDLLQKDHPDWTFSAHMEADATKAQLSQLMGGDQTPSLLFTSSHGIDFPTADSRQHSHQGALLCQEWPGPSWKGKFPQDFYFAGDDLTPEQNLLGLICFSFACYSAGTPRYDNFSAMIFKDPKEIAPHSFMAQLPSRMLSHAPGGALAFIGHVDRAWGYSFMWPGAGPQTATMESMLRRLLDGHPVGSAVEYLNQRYAEVASELTLLQDDYDFKKIPDPRQVASLWTANNDARDYAIIGDPAVRLSVATSDEAPQARPIVIDTPTVLPTSPSLWSEEKGVKRGAIEDDAPLLHLSLQSDEEISLKISTYEASDVENGPRTLKIQTEIVFGGDLETTVSESVTEESDHLLNIHSRSTHQAIRARLAYLRMTQEKD